jgi:hypothetical protein
LFLRVKADDEASGAPRTRKRRVAGRAVAWICPANASGVQAGHRPHCCPLSVMTLCLVYSWVPPQRVKVTGGRPLPVWSSTMMAGCPCPRISDGPGGGGDRAGHYLVDQRHLPLRRELPGCCFYECRGDPATINDATRRQLVKTCCFVDTNPRGSEFEAGCLWSTAVTSSARAGLSRRPVSSPRASKEATSWPGFVRCHLAAADLRRSHRSGPDGDPGLTPTEVVSGLLSQETPETSDDRRRRRRRSAATLNRAITVRADFETHGLRPWGCPDSRAVKAKEPSTEHSVMIMSPG